MSQDLPAAADPEAVITDHQVECLFSPEAAIPLLGSRIAPAHDRRWVDFCLTAFGRLNAKAAVDRSRAMPRLHVWSAKKLCRDLYFADRTFLSNCLSDQ